ncbi:hypothetical protein E0H51_31600 [Rhizobium leguminosarum bv. viciae]|uniref:hypothetical protein n=1 Tax=Rhizobium leguminosarum TaxID=384 RepID=UPI001039A3A6|nr:hypothetical protein [Rhizobium leguminosarum]TBY68955.1 hypothetical protein E0H51_31600 [Rhizobium leguminosarum bv. viciae]
MSLAKELLFGNDPKFDKDRERLREHAAATVDKFPIPLRGKRKGADGRWSPHWDLSVEDAAKELGVQYIRVNSRFAFKTLVDKIAVGEKAECVWQAKVAEFNKWLEQNRNVTKQ